jgi:hypothetical protein
VQRRAGNGQEEPLNEPEARDVSQKAKACGGKEPTTNIQVNSLPFSEWTMTGAAVEMAVCAATISPRQLGSRAELGRRRTMSRAAMKVESRIDRKTIQKRQSRPPPPPKRFAGLNGFGPGRRLLLSPASSRCFSDAACSAKASEAARPQSTSGVCEGLLLRIDSAAVPKPPGRKVDASEPDEGEACNSVDDVA